MLPVTKKLSRNITEYIIIVNPPADHKYEVYSVDSLWNNDLGRVTYDMHYEEAFELVIDAIDYKVECYRNLLEQKKEK